MSEPTLKQQSTFNVEALCAVLLALLGLTFGYSTAAAADTPAIAPNLAINDPDQFAWRLFAAVNRPAGQGHHQTQWETWAEQEYVYGDPCSPRPTWPDDPGLTGGPSSLVETLKHLANRQGVSDLFNLVTDECNFQQVKLNRPFFHYLVENELWYQEGVIHAASTRGIHFPHEAVVFKVDWKEIDESEKSRYYWRLVSQDEWCRAMGDTNACSVSQEQWCKAQLSGKSSGDSDRPKQPILLGVRAFHIVSKAIDNWVWTTWNHADEPGRCDYIGCKDSFGVIPPKIAPHVELGRLYDPGVLTDEAEQLLRDADLDPSWRNYRLMGTQVTFTDSTGRPTLLGNAILEPGFGNSSSCMTCHAQSTINQRGQSMFFFKSIEPLVAYYGTPDPSWYYPQASGPGGDPALPFVYQLDFMHQLHDQTLSREACCPPTGSLQSHSCQ